MAKPKTRPKAKSKPKPKAKAKPKAGAAPAAPPRAAFSELTPLEQFFVDGHHRKKPAAWVAVELGVPVALVAARFAELSEAAGDSKFKDSGIVTHREATVMTREASEKADELRRRKPAGPPSASHRRPGLHVIDKNRKAY